MSQSSACGMTRDIHSAAGYHRQSKRHRSSHGVAASSRWAAIEGLPFALCDEDRRRTSIQLCALLKACAKRYTPRATSSTRYCPIGLITSKKNWAGSDAEFRSRRDAESERVLLHGPRTPRVTHTMAVQVARVGRRLVVQARALRNGGHNQPPVNPARRNPPAMYGHPRINCHKNPVR